MYVCRRLNLGRIRKDIDNSRSNLGTLQNNHSYVARRIFKTRSRRPRHPKNPTRFSAMLPSTMYPDLSTVASLQAIVVWGA
jgi:hypothetical protein